MGVYSFRIYIASVLFIVSCGKQITSEENSQTVEIEGAYINYSLVEDSNSARVIAQLDFSSNTPLESIEDVWFEMDNSILTEIFLYDDGTNGDIVSDNGSYNRDMTIDELDDNIYDVLFYISTVDGNLYLLHKELTVGDYPTSISHVCMPETYTIQVSEPDSFLVYISVDDPNGNDDILSVTLQKKKLDGYEVGNPDDSGSCIWSSLVDNEFSDVVDLIYIPGYMQNNNCDDPIQEDNPSNFLYVTGLEISPLEECGPHGPIAFRYKITDQAGTEVFSSEYVMLICHPGECE